MNLEEQKPQLKALKEDYVGKIFPVEGKYLLDKFDNFKT